MLKFTHSPKRDGSSVAPSEDIAMRQAEFPTTEGGSAPFGPLEQLNILPNSLHQLGASNPEGFTHLHYLYASSSQASTNQLKAATHDAATNPTSRDAASKKLRPWLRKKVRQIKEGGNGAGGKKQNNNRVASYMGDLAKTQSAVHAYLAANRSRTQAGLATLLLFGWHLYLVMALWHDFGKAFGLLVVTLITWVLVLYFKVYKRSSFAEQVGNAAGYWLERCDSGRSMTKIACFVVIVLAIVGFLIWDTRESRGRLTGLVGMVFLIVVMFLCSKDSSKINWRPILFGLLAQFLFGLAILRWEFGSRKFNDLADAVLAFMDFSKNGTDFVYGFLSAPPNICGMEPVFAFASIQVLVYFGAMVSLLYYYGVMQFVLKKMAWAMQCTLGTTACESLNACACVFLGMSEAPLLIRPYLERMTASELHAVMTSGFSCIAGSLFATYISFGACPRYLLSSTIMSAPGSLACSKLLYPECEESVLASVDDLELPQGEESGPLECISNGAVAAVELVIAIVANLIAFLALLALIDSILLHLGHLVGAEGLSLELSLGYLFFPLTYLMGVTASPAETLRVAELMGTKTVLNEFIAYKQLGERVATGQLSARPAMIATYALCGFSNFGSIGIALGTLGGMAPRRKPLFAKLALRALLAGSISCFLTASLAGVLVDTPVACKSASSHQSDQRHCFNLAQFQRVFTLPAVMLGTQGAMWSGNATTTNQSAISGGEAGGKNILQLLRNAVSHVGLNGTT